MTPPTALSILLVEDNPFDARLVQELLKRVVTLPGGGLELQPHVIVHVTRLQEAVDRLEAGAFDVILLDLSLPDAYGLQAVTQLTTAAPDVPIVVMSTHRDEPFALAGVQAGAQDYLVKGRVDGDGLLRALRYAIARKRDEDRARTLIEKSPIGTCIIDEQGVFEVVNPTYAALFGYTREEMVGRHCTMIVAEEQRADYIADVRARLIDGREVAADYEMLTKAGARRMMHSKAIRVIGADGRPRHACYIVDVTEQKHHEQQLSHAAHHDSLTGLPNRVLFGDRLEQAKLAAKRQNTTLAVVQIDLNRFKEINDTYGHAAGDSVLTTVAGRMSTLAGHMSTLVRASDTVARLGGDEFALLLPGADEAGALHVANKVHMAICLPIELPAHTVTVDACIGIALYPEHSEDSFSLVQYADQAMYVAKTAGGGVVVYTPELDGAHAPVALASELSRAVTADQLRVYYQPVFDHVGDRVTRVEALVRWQHPTRGLLEPNSFIALAEQTGFIKGLTVWVLEEALRQCREWQDAGIELGMSVNVSVQTLQDDQFPDLVKLLLREHAISPERLTLEITERSLTTRPVEVLGVLHCLADLGVRVALDDFGVGHSSLAALGHLPFHELKVDRSFIQKAGSAHGSLLVSFIVGLGVALGLNVVVEGVEERITWEWLRRLGCPSEQGYYLCRPLPASELTAWIRTQNGPEVESAQRPAAVA